MLMQAQPIYEAYEAVTGGKAVRTVYLTPQGERFTQQKAAELAEEEELILLCGHYEGIDERVLEEIVTDYISIGDYVLTGGELAGMVMIDAIARLVPGVLGNEDSSQEESFFNDLLVFPAGGMAGKNGAGSASLRRSQTDQSLAAGTVQGAYGAEAA